MFHRGQKPVIQPWLCCRRTGNNAPLISDISPAKTLLLLNIGAFGRRVAS
jgi:hypothetical protein